MIKRFIFSFLIVSIAFTATAQDAAQLHETARTFMRQADYANAILVLNRATKLDPKNIEILKDLGLNYYFSKDYAKALEIYKPLLDRPDADDQCFQVAGDIYLATDNPKECEKVYKRGLKQFPQSGALYNELGELLWAQKDYTAIKQWEKGIQSDPGFSKNYYNACKYYYFTTDKTWSILYGEVFLNIEPSSTLSPEIKNILLESYKKLFAEANLENEKNNPEKNAFTQAFLQTMNKQSNLAASGINTESLTMIRTRFILDWFTDFGNKFPFKLFELQRQLLQEGMFDAYNQWIFTAAQNLPAYQNWINLNANEYNELTRFQRGRIFKIPSGQYYH
ncbi:tetratricopeptide repeat protein [Ferruginibacter sp. SUN106]|uniref:tetratricopeptide repeat protein n=1 Tax=Ferruginibacter sp. SUN106 TaxID=2978348 RepID=UPI003D35C156